MKRRKGLTAGARRKSPPEPQANSPLPGNGPHSFAGGGEMARLIESFDWSRSPLGPLAQWPLSLKIALNICLQSRFQVAIFGGPELVFLYNDAEREVIGSLHPAALGKPAREVLVDMWDIVQPMLYKVLEGGEATWSVDRPLLLDRHGVLEEVFFTWSYSPIPDDAGVCGVLLITQDTTQRVLGERRLQTLKDMAAETAPALNTEQACATAMRILGQNPADIPFALLYLMDGEGSLQLSLSTGVNASAAERFPFEKVTRHGEALQIDHLARFFDSGAGCQLPESALILPVLESGHENIAGFLVAGVSDHRRLDTAYRNFFDMVAAQIGTTIASARAREQERIRSNAIAELHRAKTAFFTNISHEFRTPLTLILGVVEQMLAATDHRLRDAECEQLSVVRRNGVRLLKLVNTLLAFSSVEAGRFQAFYRPTDLAAFTTELASGFRSTIEHSGLTFVVQSQTLPEPVYVDPDMWEKIVLNLISNAFKFTLEGQISVTLKSVENVAQLVVKDTGIGIQEDELPRIFERFHRVEGASGRTQEGTGIGLALVQELVRLHGGSIRAESVPGKGTTFVVSIPLGVEHLTSDRVLRLPTPVSYSLTASASAEEARRWLPGAERDDHSSRAANSPASPVGDRPFILVADDNADMRDYLRSLLEGRYTVETVADGEQVLAAVQRRRPDLVLADVMMPKLDGFSMLRRLRADPETQSIPVIMVSARAGEDNKIEGMEQGADDYLVKPFSFRELLARVQSHVELARIRRETADREQARQKLEMTLDHVRALSARLQRAREAERTSIARELHDQIGQTLTAVKLGLAWLARRLPEENHDVQERVKATLDLIDDGVQWVRKICSELRPEILDHLGLRAAIEWQSSEFSTRTGIASEVSLPDEDIALDNEQSTAFFRIFQEALTNVARHAQASVVRTSLRLQEGGAVLVVEDNGKGFREADMARGSDSLGILGMRERAEMCGGELRISDRPGHGTTVTVRIPLQPPHQPRPPTPV